MGITVGKPIGPIKLPDIAANRLAYKEFGLKKRKLELEERMAEEKLRQQKAKSGKSTKQKISSITPNFDDKFKPLHDDLMDQLDSYYTQYADELNPNNTADDDIPGVFSPKRARFVSNFENSITGFATHSGEWTTEASTFLGDMTATNDDGSQKMNLSLLEQHPVYLTMDRVNEKIGGASDYANINDPRITGLWSGNPENGGLSQELVLKEGGDPNNINDYLSENGYLIDKNGSPIIEHGAYGKRKDSGNYIVTDVFNREISPDYLGVDANGNVLYGGKQYYDYFDKNMWDQGKYIKPEEKNYIQSFAEGLEYTNLLTIDPSNPNQKIVSEESINNIRNQIGSGFNYQPPAGGKDGRWGSVNGLETAEQVAIISLQMQGITNPSKGKLADEIEKIMQNDTLPSGENKLPRVSAYDGYEIKTYNDLASELILKEYNSFNSFVNYNKPSQTQDTRDSKAFRLAMDSPSQLAFDSYDISGSNFVTGYGAAPAKEVLSEISGNRSFAPFQDLGTGDVDMSTYNNTGFLTGNETLTKAIENMTGQFKSGGNVSLVPINRQTGEIMDGKWDAGNQIFSVSESYTKDQAELCIVVPCYYGKYELSKKDMKSVHLQINPNGKASEGDLAKYINKDQGSINVFIPVTRVHSVDRAEYVYGDYMDMAMGISNDGIHYGGTGQNKDLTPGTGYKFPGGYY